jgi:hypothetical protein
MSFVDRRGFLVSLTMTPFAGALFDKEPPLIVQIESASAFYAPHVEEELHPGLPLDVEIRAGSAWLIHRGLIIGRLPRLAAELLEKHPQRLRIAEVDHDEENRLRISVRFDR